MYYFYRPPVGSLVYAVLRFYERCWWAFYDIVLKDDAETRGQHLLREWLSPEQRAQFDAHTYFDVIGCHTGKRYRIRHGYQVNVEELDEKGQRAFGWCFGPRGNLVAGDVMLAQKIALETGENATLAIANQFPARETP
jgi:hypothetical protein